MPFTPAHPAIILPFIQQNPKYVSASALIIGSMAPDFEYFFKMAVNGKYGHTFWGLLYFDVPVTILLLVVFHVFVKHDLIMNLPVALQQKFHQVGQLDFIAYFSGHIPVVLISSWAGAALHICWDGFTHSSGYFVQEIYFLRNTHITFGDLRLPLFFVLQHASTGIGLIIIVVYIRQMKVESAARVNTPSLFYWLILVVITAVVVLIRFFLKSSDFGIGNLIVTCISGFCISLLLLSWRRIFFIK